MPIENQGWELHIIRKTEQRRPSDGRRRTVGRYQVYHEGVAQTGTDLSGMTAEAKGPGANAPADNGKRIEAGRYPLLTHEPGGYATWDYSNSQDPGSRTKAGLRTKTQGHGPPRQHSRPSRPRLLIQCWMVNATQILTGCLGAHILRAKSKARHFRDPGYQEVPRDRISSVERKENSAGLGR